jgi:hypothetical protein
MIHRITRRTGALALALLVAAFLAACASQLERQQVNPAYVNKKFKRVLVVGMTTDDLARRVYEDDASAKLRGRGIEAVPGYTLMPKPGSPDEATLKRLIAESGADGVLTTRITTVTTDSIKTGGATVAMGVGWGGFYNYYTTAWQTVYVPSQSVSGLTTVVSETRLYDARSGDLAWLGMVQTLDRGGTLGAGLAEYTDVIFGAMLRDGVI